MKTKKQLHVDEVPRVLRLTDRAIADNCPDGRKVYPTKPCTNSACPWGVAEPGYMNCSFVASEAGDHTLDAIGAMMKITREGARLIERRALLKLRHNKQLRDAFTAGPRGTALHQSCMAAGSNLDSAIDEGVESVDEFDVVPAFDDRELA